MAKKRGRPSDYSKALSERILDAISQSTSGLEKICKMDETFPHAATVRRWIATKDDFRDRYARAKEQQADLLADELIDISDNTDTDTVSNEQIASAKLRIETRKWVAAKLKPKFYGERIHQEVTGKDGKDLFKAMSDQDIKAELAKIMSKIKK